MNKNRSLFVLAFILYGCAQCETTEVTRLRSPDNKADVVVSIKNCGATTSNALSVFVVREGHDVTDSDEVFRADKVFGFVPKWEGVGQLSLRYEKARIFKYTNFHQFINNNDIYHIDIKESAAAGN